MQQRRTGRPELLAERCARLVRAGQQLGELALRELGADEARQLHATISSARFWDKGRID